MGLGRRVLALLDFAFFALALVDVPSAPNMGLHLKHHHGRGEEELSIITTVSRGTVLYCACRTTLSTEPIPR
jgi:hypothetical protein